MSALCALASASRSDARFNALSPRDVRSSFTRRSTSSSIALSDEIFGAVVGLAVGFAVGTGVAVGLTVGFVVGTGVGVGFAVGFAVGAVVGFGVGFAVGAGVAVGFELGHEDGILYLSKSMPYLLSISFIAFSLSHFVVCAVFDISDLSMHDAETVRARTGTAEAAVRVTVNVSNNVIFFMKFLPFFCFVSIATF